MPWCGRERRLYSGVAYTLAVLDKKLKLNDFNPWDLGQCKALALGRLRAATSRFRSWASGEPENADTESVEARLDFRFSSMRASLGEIEAGDFAEADMLGFLERDSGRVIFVVNRRSGTSDSYICSLITASCSYRTW